MTTTRSRPGAPVALLLTPMFLAAVAAGCGNVAVAPITAMQACADLAQAMCAKRASCTNGAGITRANGDMDSCLAEEQQQCTLALAAPGTGNSPDATERCVSSFGGLSCTDFLNGSPPVACTPAGSRAVGEPCAFNGQCGSAFCARAKTSVCGTCAAPPSVGDPCLDGNCAHGQTCVNSTNTCQAIVAGGQPCDGQTCSAGYNCVAADVINTGPGTCEMAGASVGAACGSGSASCAVILGLACGGPAGAKTCMMITYGDDGAACGPSTDTGRAACKAGGCYTASGPAPEAQTGTCKADVGAGGACDIMLGPQCKPPGRCVVAGTSTAGSCTIPDPTACG
jgi:hypothetical protein